METAIASWGNSEAVRIPKDLLRRVGLKKGDRVSLCINRQGRLELVPQHQAHRRVLPERGVTFDSLFKNYEGGAIDNTSAWPADEFVGAERDAWLS